MVALRLGHVNRAQLTQGYAGGKSAHVAMVLRTLGDAPLWTGLCGGSTGTELTADLRNLGIETYPCNTAGTTRTNLEIIDDQGTVTEILEQGSAPSDGEITAFEETCSELFSHGKEQLWVIFSGSLPPGVSADFYSRLISAAKSSGCSTCLDTGGEALRAALSRQPDFVKPNRDEASSVLGIQIDSLQTAATGLRQIIRSGARSAALSLGAKGMLYCPGQSEPIFFAPTLSIPVRSTVGCGDSAVAGFVHSAALKAAPEDALRLATACAAANCLADSPGAACLSDIRKLLALVQVEVLCE
jgi:1-phosphofructokinase